MFNANAILLSVLFRDLPMPYLATDLDNNGHIILRIIARGRNLCLPIVYEIVFGWSSRQSRWKERCNDFVWVSETHDTWKCSR